MIALSPGTLALFLAGLPEPVVVETDDYIILGRNIGGRYPSLDLSTLQPDLNSVSTHHAAIILSDGDYYLTDLNSRCGTWVNDKQLLPETPHRLQNGDQVRLGELTVYVCFVVKASAA